MARQQNEFRLQCVVADFLATCVPDLLWSAFPAGEARSKATGGRLSRMGLKRGWPDIIAVLPDGRTCGFELKAEGEYLRPEQRAIRDGFHARGAPHFVIRSLDDLRQSLAELNVPTRERASS